MKNRLGQARLRDQLQDGNRSRAARAAEIAVWPPARRGAALARSCRQRVLSASGLAG